MPESLPSKKPWPMKWIVLVILACIIPYTWLTLRYRKPGPAFEPYQDTKERVQVKRLVDAQFRRVPAIVLDSAAPDALKPAQPFANVRRVPGGVPEALRAILIDPPQPPLVVEHVIASATTRADAPYPITFTYTASRQRPHLSPSVAYLHDRDVTVIIELDLDSSPSGERSETATVRLPPRLFDSGLYTVTLVAQNESQTWEVEAN